MSNSPTPIGTLGWTVHANSAQISNLQNTPDEARDPANPAIKLAVVKADIDVIDLAPVPSSSVTIPT